MQVKYETEAAHVAATGCRVLEKLSGWGIIKSFLGLLVVRIKSPHKHWQTVMGAEAPQRFSGGKQIESRSTGRLLESLRVC